MCLCLYLQMLQSDYDQVTAALDIKLASEDSSEGEAFYVLRRQKPTKNGRLHRRRSSQVSNLLFINNPFAHFIALKFDSLI